MLCGVPAAAGAVPEGEAVAADPPYSTLYLPPRLDCGVLQGTVPHTNSSSPTMYLQYRYPSGTTLQGTRFSKT